MQEEDYETKQQQKKATTDVWHGVEGRVAQGYLSWWTNSEDEGREGDKESKGAGFEFKAATLNR